MGFWCSCFALQSLIRKTGSLENEHTFIYSHSCLIIYQKLSLQWKHTAWSLTDLNWTNTELELNNRNKGDFTWYKTSPYFVTCALYSKCTGTGCFWQNWTIPSCFQSKKPVFLLMTHPLVCVCGCCRFRGQNSQHVDVLKEWGHCRHKSNTRSAMFGEGRATSELAVGPESIVCCVKGSAHGQ